MLQQHQNPVQLTGPAIVSPLHKSCDGDRRRVLGHLSPPPPADPGVPELPSSTDPNIKGRNRLPSPNYRGQASLLPHCCFHLAEFTASASWAAGVIDGRGHAKRGGQGMTSVALNVRSIVWRRVWDNPGEPCSGGTPGGPQG